MHVRQFIQQFSPRPPVPVNDFSTIVHLPQPFKQSFDVVGAYNQITSQLSLPFLWFGPFSKIPLAARVLLTSDQGRLTVYSP